MNDSNRFGMQAVLSYPLNFLVLQHYLTVSPITTDVTSNHIAKEIDIPTVKQTFLKILEVLQQLSVHPKSTSVKQEHSNYTNSTYRICLLEIENSGENAFYDSFHEQQELTSPAHRPVFL